MSQIGDNYGPVKPVLFHPAAQKAIRSFPRAAQWEVGGALWELQTGQRLTMPQSRPMRSIGMGVEELRVKDPNGIYRVFYVLRSERGVIVFHAFNKKTQKTPSSEIELGRRRLKDMLNVEED